MAATMATRIIAMETTILVTIILVMTSTLVNCANPTAFPDSGQFAGGFMSFYFTDVSNPDEYMVSVKIKHYCIIILYFPAFHF